MKKNFKPGAGTSDALAVMLPTTALAAGITTDDDLIAAVNAAADGDTITLGEGTFDPRKNFCKRW